MKHFGEETESFRCVTSCDNCRMHGHYHSTDDTADALKVIQTTFEISDKHYNCNTLKLLLMASRQSTAVSRKVVLLKRKSVRDNLERYYG